MNPQRNKTVAEQLAEQQQQDQNKQFRRLLIIIGIIIMMLLLFRACTPPAEEIPDDEVPKVGMIFNAGIDENAQPGDFEGMSEEEIQAALNDKVEAGMMNIHMMMEPVFPSGTEKGNIGIYVEPQNREPQVVQIIRSDTNEVIYTTGIIPIGNRIETDKLDVDLDPGYYPCRARFHRVDPETGKVLGIAEHEIRVAVLG